MSIIPSTTATITVNSVATTLGNATKNMGGFRGFGGSVPSSGAISMSQCQKIQYGVGYYNSWQTPNGVANNRGAWDNASITNNASMTCSVWLKSTALTGNWRNLFHVAAPTYADFPRKPSVYIVAGASGFHIKIETTASGVNGQEGPDNSTMQISHNGLTYHFLITYNGTTLKVYSNGGLTQTFTMTGTPVSATGYNVWSPDSNWVYTDGSLNYLWFFPYPMTDSQVSTYYNSLASTLAPGLQNYIFTIQPVGTSGYSGTAPSFGTSYVTFTPASSQYINWGTRTFNLGTSGFSAKLKIAWTGYNNWSRVFDFNSGTNGVTDMFLTIPGTGSSPLRFQYKENGAEQITDYNATISLNTVYNISVVYNPTIGSTGRVQIWVNGSVVVTNTGMTYKGTDKSYTYTYVGKSSYPADAYLGAQIYFLNVYNYPLSDAEAAATY